LPTTKRRRIFLAKGLQMKDDQSNKNNQQKPNPMWGLQSLYSKQFFLMRLS